MGMVMVVVVEKVAVVVVGGMWVEGRRNISEMKLPSPAAPQLLPNAPPFAIIHQNDSLSTLEPK